MIWVENVDLEIVGNYSWEGIIVVRKGWDGGIFDLMFCYYFVVDEFVSV